jgi:hypothetical protein
VRLQVAAAGGGGGGQGGWPVEEAAVVVGARAAGRWAGALGISFFFMKLSSPRARWISRRMSAERGPTCFQRRRLRWHSGAERPSPRASSR